MAQEGVPTHALPYVPYQDSKLTMLLQEALSLRDSIHEIPSKIQVAADSRDISLLSGALLEFQRAGLPPLPEVDAAQTLKTKIEEMLARLSVAVQLLDIRVLKAAIAECEAAGLPEHDLNEAFLAKSGIERMRLDMS